MDVDDLYGLPLDEFVPARSALARELRNGGRREEAAAVAALRKPSVAAWAVNQLVRTQRRAVAELFEAGDALRAAHEKVLAGRSDGNELRAAVERERARVDELTGAARGLLTSQGHELSQTIIDRVADTLHAAALDDDGRSQVKDGRLERELRHVGLGLAAAGTLPAPARRAARKPAGSKPAGGKAGKNGEAEQRAADRAAAEQAERERAEARAAARATEREARRRLERAERAANSAAERRDRAATALEDAEAELSDAEAELEEARDQLGTAEQALRELGR